VCYYRSCCRSSTREDDHLGNPGNNKKSPLLSSCRAFDILANLALKSTPRSVTASSRANTTRRHRLSISRPRRVALYRSWSKHTMLPHTLYVAARGKIHGSVTTAVATKSGSPSFSHRCEYLQTVKHWIHKMLCFTAEDRKDMYTREITASCCPTAVAHGSRKKPPASRSYL
jgi:hypothetical protein